MKKYKTFSGQKTFFGEEEKLNKLSRLGDNLLKLRNEINWEIFRKPIEEELYLRNEQGGRPPYDYVIMMKILVLQRYYNLSDAQTEFQLNDRLSFQRFLDISIDDDIPDATTIAYFKNQLAEKNLVKKLFKLFLKEIKGKGIIGKRRRIIDASFIEVPKQRNSKDENDQIKKGKTPNNWDKNPHKKAQKDVDARWTKKNNQTYYGYKNHVKADSKSKIILGYETTAANIHDSQVVEDLIDEEDKNKELYADCAYKSEEIDQILKKFKIKNKILEKGYRNNPLTKKQIKENKKKSSIRVRIEHIFGFIENSMNGSTIRSIGKLRADANIGIMNLTYNIFRMMQLA